MHIEKNVDNVSFAGSYDFFTGWAYVILINWGNFFTQPARTCAGTIPVRAGTKGEMNDGTGEVPLK